jgi:CDP-diacylglycerol--glycerol-3-phosphate 3-phosphatidyltransferase
VLAKVRHSLAHVLSRLPVALLSKTRLSPNALTVFGFLATLPVAWVLYTGRFFLGGFLVLVCGSLDFLDGALARATGRSTKFGAFLDSTLDRFSEAVLFLGLLAYYVGQGAFQESILIGAALTGSMLTSYTRARAEGLGLQGEVGLLTRTERVILLAVGLIVSQWADLAMVVVLWILAVLTNLIAAQRIFYVWRQTGGR